jgi:peptidyl-prolyl cis-trans isomerase A (cyclophilin A)
MIMKRTLPTLLAVATFMATNSEKSLSAQEKTGLKDGLYAEIDTNHGKIMLGLEFEKCPLTVCNFASLAEGTMKTERKGPYYDGLVFHRIIKDFMLQAGCPQGTGTGGPGYKFRDEIDPSLKHTGVGILSMANSGPATNGSQFFITHKATPWLDGKHTVFGKVVQGMDVVDKIANVAVNPGDKPKEPVAMKKVSILRVGKKARAFKTGQSAFDAALKGGAKKEEKHPNVIAGEKHLKETKTKDDYKSTESELVYKVIKEGDGKQPNTNSYVTVHYEGQLIDGTVFDSSYKRQEPTSFPLNQVIPGWTEGLQLMKIGSTYEFHIPHDLAYGERGAGGVIPPYSTLIFKVELISFK